MIMQFISRLMRDTSGFGAMELGLSLPFVTLLGLGMMDASLLVGKKIDFEQAAERGTDFALAERPNGTSGTKFRDEVAAAAGVAKDDVDVTIFATCDGAVQADFNAGCASGSRPHRYVEIAIASTVDTQFDWSGLSRVIGFSGVGDNVVVSGTSRVRFQ